MVLGWSSSEGHLHEFEMQEEKENSYTTVADARSEFTNPNGQPLVIHYFQCSRP